jgi:hypothetical protein
VEYFPADAIARMLQRKNCYQEQHIAADLIQWWNIKILLIHNISSYRLERMHHHWMLGDII